MTIPLFSSMIVTQGEGLANLTEPHHIPSPQEHQSPQSDCSPQNDSPPLSHQTIIHEPIPHDLQAPTKTLTLRRLTKKAIRIAQSKALLPDADEPASLLRDNRHRGAFLLGIIDIKEELGADKGTEKGNNDIEEMVNVLSSMEAANILSSKGATFLTHSVSPADVFPTAGVPTVSGSFPTVAREMEEEFARENQRLSVQAARDSEIARIHAEEELKLMIKGLDRSNEVIAKHLCKYKQAEGDLSIREKIELIRSYQFFVDMLKQFDREDLHQHWILVKETFSIKQSTRDKEKELWVELKRMFESDFKDQLWTYHQAFMHDPLD
nr:hypothetical protein [Tanacetum cinerariifolium]